MFLGIIIWNRIIVLLSRILRFLFGLMLYFISSVKFFKSMEVFRVRILENYGILCKVFGYNELLEIKLNIRYFIESDSF